MKSARNKLLCRTPAKSSSESLKEEPVEVYCRIKPISSYLPRCIAVISPTTLRLTPPDATKEIQYTFSQVFDEKITQKEVFDKVALPLVSNLINGENGLLFTYGVTGSGKTFTMNGEPQNGGIMPRCLDIIFNSITRYQAGKFVFKPDKMNGFEVLDSADIMIARQNDIFFQNGKSSKTPRRREFAPETKRARDSTKVETVNGDYQYSVFITYIEIYNNSVYDLLDDDPEDQKGRRLQSKLIREDEKGNMYVHGVTEVEVKSPEEAFQFFYKGQGKKTMAHTRLNADSSRSHSVFTIRLVQAPTYVNGENIWQNRKTVKVNQLSLVDLAGSERTNRTKNTGDRLREAGNINNSLMTLRQCLEYLRENQKVGFNKNKAPYRDSKLTFFFKNYFEGNGQVRMILCVNPQMEDYEENVHVLKFAEMTQEVKIIKQTPSKPDIGLTPGRWKTNRYAKKIVDQGTPLKEINLNPKTDLSLLPPFPNLYLTDADDDDTLKKLSTYLETMIAAKSTALDELEQQRYDLRRKMEESEGTITELQREIANKDMIISQHNRDKEKVKEKCVSKIAATKEKLAMEMQREREEVKNQLRDEREKVRFIKKILSDEATSKVTPRTFGLKDTPYLSKFTTPSQGSYVPQTATPSQEPSARQNATPSQGPSRRGVAVSNPRHRRSRSAGGGDVWLDHRPAMAIDLNTVFQPTLRKRKSITKLTDVNDIVNSKTSKYCLTTQEQDTDGELETKLYKGDVIPTIAGGAQVILNDVEVLKQLSPTSEAASRKRSFTEGTSEYTESRCAMSIEGHSKKSRN